MTLESIITKLARKAAERLASDGSQIPLVEGEILKAMQELADEEGFDYFPTVSRPQP